MLRLSGWLTLAFLVASCRASAGAAAPPTPPQATGVTRVTTSIAVNVPQATPSVVLGLPTKPFDRYTPTTPAASATQAHSSATPTPQPVSPVTPTPALEIQSFAVDVEELEAGKRLTFHWRAVGGTSARIISGTAHRFIPWWEVPLSGTLTVELRATVYPNPPMWLVVSDDTGNEVRESVVVSWACDDEYFFSPPPDACPLGAVQPIQAAEQVFQHGRMIWLEQLRSGSYTYGPMVYVLYDDGFFDRFEDTWTANEPDSDPSILAPPGLSQPIRGFGKVWREHPDVRERLGWGLAPETGYRANWQWQGRESIPSASFVSTSDNRVVHLFGEVSGSWTIFAP